MWECVRMFVYYFKTTTEPIVMKFGLLTTFYSKIPRKSGLTRVKRGVQLVTPTVFSRLFDLSFRPDLNYCDQKNYVFYHGYVIYRPGGR